MCGDDFIGRVELIASLLASDESCNWIIGKRRIGKTSLLRHLERVANQDLSRFALFWDIQGSFDGKGLFDSLYDALEDSQDSFPERWRDLAFELADTAQNAADLLKKLSRALSRAGVRLFLLIDEAEELINIGKGEPVLLGKLRRFFQTNRNVITALVSTPRLEELHKTAYMETSPFLHGFSVSFLGNFSKAESDALLERGIEDRRIIDQIYELTDGNPFETQLIAKHYAETGDMKIVLPEIETNPMLRQTIEVNFNLLTASEKNMLVDIAADPAGSTGNAFEPSAVAKMVNMGYLKRAKDARLTIGSRFQAKALASSAQAETPEPLARSRDGRALSAKDERAIRLRLVELYKTFLETAQEGKRIANPGECFRISEEDAVLFDQERAEFLDERRQEKAWRNALREMAAYLESLVDPEVSWPLSRLLQMVEQDSGLHLEKDFLDLMILVSEEAALV